MRAGRMDRQGAVVSVLRALAVAYTKKTALNKYELEKLTGCHKPTIYRIVADLKKAGYLGVIELLDTRVKGLPSEKYLLTLSGLWLAIESNPDDFPLKNQIMLTDGQGCREMAEKFWTTRDGTIGIESLLDLIRKMLVTGKGHPESQWKLTVKTDLEGHPRWQWQSSP